MKPGNVFLVKQDDDEDFVKVLDFGLVKETAARVIRAAKAQGKQAAAAAPASEARFWIEQGVDLYFCVNDLACMKAGAQAALAEVQAMC